MEAGTVVSNLAFPHATFAFYQFSGVGPDFETIQVESQNSARIVRCVICTSSKGGTAIKGGGACDLRLGGEVACTFTLK